MKRLLFALLATCAFATVEAQRVTATWTMDNLDYAGPATLTGDEAYTSLVTSTGYTVGSNLSAVSMLTRSGADAGYSPVTYPYPMIAFQPTAKVSGATACHSVNFSIKIAEGHTYKPTELTFNAAKIGTDAGGLIIKYKINSGAETLLAEVAPRRNKITSSESIGYTDGSLAINDVILEGGKTYSVMMYIAGNLATNKQLGLGYVTLTGAIDEQIYDLSHFISDFSFKADGETVNLFDRIKSLNNGDRIVYNHKLTEDPTDFEVTAQSGYVANVSYQDKKATLKIMQGETQVYEVEVGFMTTRYQKHTDAKPLSRALLAVRTTGGNLVSWRMRATDQPGITQYRLYRNGEYLETFLMKTNYKDAQGTSSDNYRIDVCDQAGNVLESHECAAWDRQFKFIPLAKAPADTNGTGASYTPNDATVYDMDGDGEQEIVFRWEPSNVKDGANSGTTGPVYMECVKLDGTQLWRINLGPNMWASQHTITFLCYDFDGDGFGEMIVRTAPGTVDGEGNFVLMGDDDPYASYVASNGRVSSGPEYLTVFDGLTGAAISSIDYWPAHRDYAAMGYADLNAAYGSQARIERYNATLARLDVNGQAVPCAVMNHGYYSQAYYQAAYFDGTELRQLWRKSFEKKGEGAFGQGYHTLQSGDVDGDGFDEIIVGSAVLDHTGDCLWSSGEGHGDALHVGDFDWDNPGLEVFSVMEDYDASYVHYCMDMRDALTGRLIWSMPKGDRDNGRGIAADFCPEYDGAEGMSNRSGSLHTITGAAIPGSSIQNDGKNFRIYWTGNLYDENLDGTWISKWNTSTKSFISVSKLESLVSGIKTINSTKNVPCLQADFLGDYREELIYYRDKGNNDFELVIMTTNHASDYMLPYLRDDALYDNAIAWQNATYNQPPHVGYSPVKKWEEIESATGITEIRHNEPKDLPSYNLFGQRISNDAKGIVVSKDKVSIQR